MVCEWESGKARQAEPGHGTAVLVRPRGGNAGRGWWLKGLGLTAVVAQGKGGNLE